MIPETIKFCYVNRPYGWLTNFSPYKVIFNRKEYPTSEHFYQSLKFPDLEKREFIRRQPTARDAAHAGRTLNGGRDDWDDIKIEIMYHVLYAKLNTNRELIEKLIATGNSILIEVSKKDRFWAESPYGEGRNELGKCWMQIREEFKNLDKYNSDGYCFLCVDKKYPCACTIGQYRRLEESKLYDYLYKE